ncbi:hypothetical protein HDU92_002416 [Lobulomyces angularis]|nr:hypothetical protein HDU92_002416 [Lobulomyces angularis]
MLNTERTTLNLPEMEVNIKKVIFISAVGTLIEWYDFFVFGTLGTVVAPQFYDKSTGFGAIIYWLATFAVGFVVRPIGAIVFGIIGDRFGRKITFLTTLIIMGTCTFLVGCLPTYNQVGDAAGALLIVLRILQGLAIGGEYGGATTYIAEHAPPHRRGFYTSFIQVTATLGLLLALIIVLIVSTITGTVKFSEYGWRIPFLFSILLLGISLYIRLSLKETPMFKNLKNNGNISKNPFMESFGKWQNAKIVLLSFFGATMGQGAVWYTAQFYSLYYLQTIFHTPDTSSFIIMGVALLLAAPFYVLFGYLSDKYGRKLFMLLGLAFSCILWYPIYMGMHHFRYNETATWEKIESTSIVMFVTLVYGPIAAYLVELFPTSIRYTSLSLPYHVGNGIIGGFVPVVGLWAIQLTGNNFAGLWYPLVCAGTTFLVMLFVSPETYKYDLYETPEDQRDQNLKDEGLVRYDTQDLN